MNGMGIAYVERRLAPELCYEACAQAVDEYLEECREAGEILPPFDHLMVPIIRADFYPPGLYRVERLLRRYRHQQLPLTEAPDGDQDEARLRLPNGDELIEELMHPYPVRRLRAHSRRVWKTIHKAG